LLPFAHHSPLFTNHSSLIAPLSRSALRFFRCYLLTFGVTYFHFFNKINLLIKTGSKLPVFSANTAGTDPFFTPVHPVHPCPLIIRHSSLYFKGADKP
jgi:hypothetical protein